MDEQKQNNWMVWLVYIMGIASVLFLLTMTALMASIVWNVALCQS